MAHQHSIGHSVPWQSLLKA